jgi:hypothetical protein
MPQPIQGQRVARVGGQRGQNVLTFQLHQLLRREPAERDVGRGSMSCLMSALPQPSFQSFSQTPFLRNGIGGLVFLPSRRQRSGVAGGFLDELHPRVEAEFGVDVGEVGLHGAR